MAAATVTAPLDVVRTRLQSSLYKAPSVAPPGVLAAASLRGSLPYYKKTMLQAGWQHVSETLALLSSIRRHEGARALFKGLGATLAGVVPARSIHFFAYGNGKRLLAQTFTGGNEDHALVHLAAGGLAGVVTSTATNPIWLVKTRMQLDRNESARAATTTRKYRNSLDCVRQVVREEGIRGLYKGMSASYLGAFETMFQWAIYEQLKGGLKRREMRLAASGREKTALDRTIDWTGWLGAAATSKLVASLLTYPHEVCVQRLISRVQVVRRFPMSNIAL